MRWDGLGDRSALGARGTYRIYMETRDIGVVWWLFATHWDLLPMLAVGGSGRPFPTLSAARQFADELDGARAESQVSGC